MSIYISWSEFAHGFAVSRWCVLPPEKPLSEDAMAELREALGHNWLLEDEEMMG